MKNRRRRENDGWYEPRDLKTEERPVPYETTRDKN